MRDSDEDTPIVLLFRFFNSPLTSVNLLNNDLGSGAATVVAAAKQHGNIKTLCGIEEGIDKVSFFNNGLKAPDAVLLSFDLEFNRALKSANLAENDIGDGGAIAISAALETNSALTSLNLQGSSFGTKITAKGAQAIVKMLEANRALTSLNLWDNQIGAGGAEAIAAALPQS